MFCWLRSYYEREVKMEDFKKNETIISIEKSISVSQQAKENNLLLAKKLYEKYIQRLEEKLLKRENKYTESFYLIQDGFNKMLNLASKYLAETVKEKEERIKHLEQIIKGLIDRDEPPSPQE